MINVLVIARLIVTLLSSHRTIEDGAIAIHGVRLGMEVERMLERHPRIAQAAVVPVDDDIKGTKPVAFAVLAPGSDKNGPPSENDIKQFALANAPAYQHPRSVWFVEELPLASTNKLDRAALKADAARRIAAPRC